jgi:hypothetical protein
MVYFISTPPFLLKTLKKYKGYGLHIENDLN